MPKALLVNPRPAEFEMLDAASIPFSILYLGTFLKVHAGWDVALVDGMTETDRSYREKVAAHARGADLVGFSVMTPQIADALAMTTLARRENPRAAIVWGGIHPTLFPDQTLRHDAIDFIAYGEGEETLLALARALGGEGRLSDVAALGFKEEGRSRLTPFRRTVDVATLPFPDHALLDNFEAYLSPRKVDNRKYVRRRYRVGQIHCGRGCPFDCAFCVNVVYDHPAMRRHRAFDVRRTHEEMKWFRDRGAEYLILQDELFFANKPRLDALVDLLEREPIGLPWDANPRVNFVNNSYLNDSALERLKAVGLEHFCFAPESGSRRVLLSLKKNVTVEQSERAVADSHRHGFRVSAGFMIGMPGEEVSDMRETLRLGIRLYESVGGDIYFIGPQVFRPYPGAALFEEARRRGLSVPRSVEEWAEAGINPYFGFLDVSRFPWLDDRKRAEINFIVKYFTVVLGTRLDRSLLSIPARAIPIAFLLHLLLRLRRAFGAYERFWGVERAILNAVTPLEHALRRVRYALRRFRRR